MGEFTVEAGQVAILKGRAVFGSNRYGNRLIRIKYGTASSAIQTQVILPAAQGQTTQIECVDIVKPSVKTTYTIEVCYFRDTEGPSTLNLNSYEARMLTIG